MTIKMKSTQSPNTLKIIVIYTSLGMILEKGAKTENKKYYKQIFAIN